MYGEFVGACAHCGQVIASDKDFDSQREADQWATENCSCDEAELERQRRESVEAADAQVDALYGEMCVDYGFKPVKANVLELLKIMARSVALGEAGRISAVLPGGGGKFSVVSTASGKVKILRVVSNAQALEA